MFGKKKRLPQNKFSRLVVTGTIVPEVWKVNYSWKN